MEGAWEMEIHCSLTEPVGLNRRSPRSRVKCRLASESS
jgi:hypothetical protein